MKRFHALWALLTVAACVTTAELLLKSGAPPAGNLNVLAALLAALSSPYTLLGIAFHLAGFAAWAYTLRSVPLALAFNFTLLQQATIPLGAALLLQETISATRWLGIAVVLAGVLLLVPAIVTAEQKTDHPRALAAKETPS